ncbi:SCF ubiquitin ligase complex subunit cdc4 [Apophysomyces ossiformis]|uniref:SCF ubiquitin ligase complex subunit cdc4 n=1 Tax=Apophysomyces ossiformis TaxID=679940 RepID=A0A8H7BLE5_9FUNG|nr:SCF ubiquitin ligase complex subunit cdc4 [Apophysomyces ossiformis]
MAHLQLSSPLPSPSATPDRQANRSYTESEPRRSCRHRRRRHSSNGRHVRASITSTLGLDDSETPQTRSLTPLITLPPIYFGPPTSPYDSSLYPLAHIPTPASINRLPFTLDGRQGIFEEVQVTERNLLDPGRAVDAPVRSPRKRSASSFSDIDFESQVQTKRVECISDKPGSQEAISCRPKRNRSAMRRLQFDSPGVSEHNTSEGQGRSSDRHHNEDDNRGTSRLEPSAAPSSLSLLPEFATHLPSAESNSSIIYAEAAESGHLSPEFRHSSTLADNTESPNSALPSPSLSPATNSDHEDMWDYHQTHIETRVASQSAVHTTGGITENSAFLDTFDALPSNIQSYFLFQLLRRSPMESLRHATSWITHALRGDFTSRFSREITHRILCYLDIRSLCRAISVCKQWKEIIENDAALWESKLIEADFVLSSAEHERLRLAASEERFDQTSRTHQNQRRQEISPDMIISGDEMETSPSPEETVSDDLAMAETHTSATQIPNQTCSLTVNSPDSKYNRTTGGEDETIECDCCISSSMLAKWYRDIYKRRYILRQNWRKNRVHRMQLFGHSNKIVTCLQFDDDKIVTSSEDHTINIYDIKTGGLRRTLQGHEGGVWAMHYVDNILVTGSTDRTIRVWDMERGVCRHVLRGHASTIRCLHVVMPLNVNPDPDGIPLMQPTMPLLVSGSRDSTLRVWKLPSVEESFDSMEDHPLMDRNGYLMHILSGHRDSVRALAVYGNILASGSYDHTVRIWNLETGEPYHVLEGHRDRVYSVVIDMKRRQCISGSLDSTVRVWSLDDGECLRLLKGHTILVGLLGLADDHLVSAAADATLRVWCPDSGDCRYVLLGHQGSITSFQHDKYKIISGSEGGVKLWDIRTGKLLHNLITDVNCVWRVAFDDRRCIAAVQSRDVTRIEVLDYGVYGLED